MFLNTDEMNVGKLVRGVVIRLAHQVQRYLHTWEPLLRRQRIVTAKSESPRFILTPLLKDERLRIAATERI